MDLTALYIDVPCAVFQDSGNEEDDQTYFVPSPLTVYELLLSFVGETDVMKHCGVKLAISMISRPQRSPFMEDQEIFTDIRFVVWVDSALEEVEPNLENRIYQAKRNPSEVRRFGCLCLGDRDNLVNSLKFATEKHISDCKGWLVQDPKGRITLPFWVDSTSLIDKLLRYSLKEVSLDCPSDSSWTIIQPDFP